MPKPEPRSFLICYWSLAAVSNSLVLAASLALASQALSATASDPTAGADVFGACATCHSLEPGQHRTGPSLAGVLGRKAGTDVGFRRYSCALKASGIVWDEATLDAWIADPRALIPGSRMAFRRLSDAQARADLITYLEHAGRQPAEAPQGGMIGTGAGNSPDLRMLGPEHRVAAIRHCGDTYEVATADGKTEPFWEMNLRFKTDRSRRGPEPGKPVIIGAGMMGDSASIIFDSPAEISPSIREECPP